MAELKIEWDPRKAASNQRKHGISFEEASTAFSDERARIVSDPDHSEDEERFVLLGMSWSLRVLVVCHCYREKSDLIRIFSARRATKAERAQYGVG
ncbi:MAG: BrnT family toxin [Herbaspirillum sp.]|uniref:BrnT family toxin n=1 Tax=Herbaspirillum sp. TaxID=1890675 RepID=UPI002582E5BE|nr:BrnT family toxin [Herbaspirillum sp.]MCP4556349.1 BrnT family toxin [Herbaspirillum sp.]